MNELWQKIQILRQQLIDLNILRVKPKNPNRLMRPYTWKSNCPEDIFKEIESMITYFQNDREFWYCISYNLNPFTEEFICPICKNNRIKFMGRQGSKCNGAYKSTCINCSSNQLEEKKEHTRATIASHTKEDKQRIRERCQATRLKHFGDPNYGLFGSKSFKKNLLDKYGDENYNNREKTRNTNIERYGVPCTLQIEEIKQHSLEIKNAKYGCGQNLEKLKETNLKRYGVEYYVQSPEFKEKSKETMIDNYGSVENSYMQRMEVSKKTKLEKYDNEYYSNIQQAVETRKLNGEDFAKSNNATQVKDIISKYGQGWLSLDIPRLYYQEKAYIENSYLPEIEKYANELHKSQSKIEIEVQNFIKTLIINVLCNDNKTIPHYELDIYLPDKNLAFEINGIYWHSINVGKDVNYHINKTIACEKQGITLIHIFEDTWINNRLFCEQLIKDIIGNKQIYTEGEVDRCYYYPQENYSVIKTTEPRAFYFKKNYNRIYVTDENMQDLLNNGYLVCYDCGQVFLERNN